MSVNRIVKRAAVALVAAGVVTAGSLAVAAPAQAAYACHYSQRQVSGNNFLSEFAGYYSGMTVVPSSTGVTAAGIEAQCLLKFWQFNPGTVDGVFGANSQSAMRAFQTKMNSLLGAHMTVDGLPGPQSWFWLRNA
jgi:putative peptidoglycan binding protein